MSTCSTFHRNWRKTRTTFSSTIICAIFGCSPTASSGCAIPPSIAIADHTVQIRDVYNSHLEIKQNRIMTILTVVTTIFMPLTLIAGWYGMNFRYMPELDAIWGYPVIIFVSILIVVGSLLFFKKKKWL